MTHLAQNSEQRRSLLQSYLSGRVEENIAPLAVSRRVPAKTAPLTFAQQQVWLHAELAPNTPLYNEPFTIHRQGPLDVKALECSFSEILRRHEAWRTSFPVINGAPVQQVNEPWYVKLPVIDLRALPESQREAEALRLATEDARRPFDLANGPLVRAQLVRLQNESYRLFVNCHHLIFDGVSGYNVFLPELVTLYNAFGAGKSSPLEDLPFQYSAYALWEREAARVADYREQLAYWREQLAGATSGLQLPTDRPRPAKQSFRGATLQIGLSRELSERLRALSKNNGVTLFMTLLASLDTLLYRYCGEQDILIGSITAGRNHPGTERLLGFFLKTVVLRTNLSGNPTFREVLARVRATTLGALSHDSVPVDEVVKLVAPDRDLSRNPLFQVLLSFEPSLSSVDSGWNLTPIDVETGTSKFDLCWVLDDRPEGLLGRIIYSTDLFDEATITRLAACWETLLNAAVANPDATIDEISTLPRNQRDQLLVEWNATQAADARTLVHDLVEEQARKAPQAVAVRCGTQSLTYDELNQRANQLASHLSRLGVRAESQVALCVERSLEMIVGVLGVLRAGGAYVPLDPTYPQERLEFMLADSGAKIVLTQNHLPFGRLSATDLRILCLDSDWRKIASESAENRCQPSLDDLAYVIYTSGSTGVPKGVMLTHRNLAHSTQARLEYYKEPLSSFLLLSSFAFDSSVAGIFHALCAGGTLVLPEPEFSWRGWRIAELIAENAVSHLLCIPTLYAEVLESATGEQMSSLKTVIVAGEACPSSVVEAHRQVLPHTPLYNEYGPTEVSVWSTVYRCDERPVQSSVPIGRAIANTRLYVLDSNRQLLPVGVPGELCISGAGVARGYLNQKQLTEERFVQDPYHAGHKMYRTGDLVRYLSDGNLEFLGRVDQQVKVRGLRIELGEVESALAAHPDVREVAVLMQESHLVAYVAARGEYTTSAAELGAWLKTRLPAYMVPAELVILENLPRNENGKLDRAALNKLRSDSTEQHVSFGPRNFVEARLLTIWKEVLGDAVSDIRQNFFELGGHSLLAAKLLDKIEKDFGQPLSLAFVFQSPTIELMAEWLRSPDQSLRARAIVPIQPNGTRTPLFWIRGGPRFRLLARKLGTDQPFLGLDLPYSDANQLAAPYRLEEIAAYLVTAMREVQPHGPYALAGLCVNGVIAYEVARQVAEQGEEVALVAMFDAHNRAYYKNPLTDGRYTGRVKYHLANLLQSSNQGRAQYVVDRLDEARRKIERTIWQLSSHHGTGDAEQLHNTDSFVHPAFHRYEPRPYSGNVVLFQSSDWPSGPYFDFERGWKDLVNGLEFHRIPGDHPSMFTEPNVEVVASALKLHFETASRPRLVVSET
ncbi:MAG TPA: amino acid adenylation domain-containing protein [Dongiaceae bacterium]|nr:amino acid adenylation domain-containing protein [Dongiaceae bacterium]